MNTIKSTKSSTIEKEVGTNDSERTKIEHSNLENELKSLITSLKSIIDTIMLNLEPCREVDNDVLQFVHLIHKIELFQNHVEFLLRVLKSISQEDVERIKEDFNDIKDSYENLHIKEDLTIMPLKYGVNFVRAKIIPETERIVKDCFKKNNDNEMELLKSEDNIAKIKIISFKYDLLVKYFPLNALFTKDDIFLLERSSPVWQDLYKGAQFKQILTEKEIQSTFWLFRMFFHVGTAIVKKRAEGEPAPHLRTAFNFFRDIVYYGLQSSKAETQALLYLMNPTIEDAFQTWNFPERPLVAKLANLRCPRMKCDRFIYIPRLFPQITKEVILQEYKENTINKIQHIDPSELKGPDLQNSREKVLNELFVKDSDKVAVRILSLKHYDFHNQLKLTSGKTHEILLNNPEEAIIIHIHGGGWVSMSSASHRVYSTRWVKGLKVPVFSIDYRKAPKNPYPDALDDVWQVYLWIINYAESILGIKPKKIILAGDSAGGNLCLALTLRLIKSGARIPQGCFLTYPALLLHEGNCTPSHYKALNDPVLHYSILQLCLNSYIPKELDPLTDPFISPLVASDELFSKLPPIRIVTGTEDPLHDDNWRFLYRARKLNRDVRLSVHQGIGHAFLNYQDMKKYDVIMQEACEFMKEMFDINYQG